MKPADTATRRLERLARDRHGVFRIDHAREVGMSRGMLDRLRRRGIVQDVHHGTYSFGCAPRSFLARARAAVDACGHGAVLTGAAAEYLWGLRKKPPRRIEVLVAFRQRPVEGISVKQTRTLPAADVTVRHGIPVLRVERLLIEVAARHDVSWLCGMMDEASFHRAFSSRRLRAVLRRSPTRRARSRVVEAHDRYLHGDGGSQSGFEVRTVERLRPLILVPYEQNRPRTFAGKRMKPDLYIPLLHLAVESDGGGHLRPTRQREDDARNRAYAKAGDTVVRIREGCEDQDLDRAAKLIVDRQAALGLAVT